MKFSTISLPFSNNWTTIIFISSWGTHFGFYHGQMGGSELNMGILIWLFFSLLLVSSPQGMCKMLEDKLNLNPDPAWLLVRQIICNDRISLAKVG